MAALSEVAYTFQPQGDDGSSWRVVRMRVREAISALFECTLDVVADDLTLDPEAMFALPAALTIRRASLTRRVCGLVGAVEDRGFTRGRHLARVVLVPELWLLSQRTNYRVFQDVDAIDVIRDVLRDAGIYQDSGRLVENLRRGDYPRREYCVQFAETDLAFVARLLEHEGIGYFFTHEGERETLHLVDGETRSFAPVPTLDRGPVAVMGEGGATASAETVRRFDFRRQLAATGITLRDYNFTNPRTVLDMTRSAPRDPGAIPRYDYPGFYTLGSYGQGSHVYAAHDGPRRAEVGSQAVQSTQRVGRGASNVTGLAPGRVFTLAGHGRPDLDARYLLTGVEHEGHALEEIAHDLGLAPATGDRYVNRFQCVPADGPTFRPAATTPRPRVPGPQTATVTAEPGSSEEICVDFYGRILVQFHWDRPELRSSTQRPKQSSCWVRVAQAWAGSQWGAVVTPRVGMEVVVHFLDGDPDRPLVTGCVYNGMQHPPLDLPAERTRSTFKTNSSPGGGGFNELTFEDLKGSEKVYLHAQRDLEEVVRHDHSTTVDRDQRNHVRRNHTEQVDGSQTLTVGGNRGKTVRGNETETIHKDQTATVLGNRTETVVVNASETITGDQSLTVAGTRTKSIAKLETNTLSLGRITTVTAFDVTIVIGASATEVVGAYNLSALAAATFVVAPSTVTLLPTSISLSNPQKVTLSSGSSKVELTPGKVSLSSGAGATLELEGSKVTINAADIHIEGSATVTVKSPAAVTVEGQLTTIKGGPVKINC